MSVFESVDEFGEEYFERERFGDGGHPAGYTSYENEPLPHDRYADRLGRILETHGFVDGTVLVAGCAYGHTTCHLREMGVDAWGMDISEWAINRAKSLYSPEWFFRGDILDGIGREFDVVYTECVIECLQDNEAVEACENIRENSDLAIHHVYTSGQSLNGDWYNSKPLSGWMALCDPGDEDLWFPHSVFVP